MINYKELEMRLREWLKVGYWPQQSLDDDILAAADAIRELSQDAERLIWADCNINEFLEILTGFPYGEFSGLRSAIDSAIAAERKP